MELILSAMDAAGVDDPADRRVRSRQSYRARAALRLFSDAAQTPPWRLYTRDVSPRGIGFLTSHRLPLGYGGSVALVAPNGDEVNIPCTLYRCREAAPGWFEGALCFNREQWVFGTTA